MRLLLVIALFVPILFGAFQISKYSNLSKAYLIWLYLFIAIGFTVVYSLLGLLMKVN